MHATYRWKALDESYNFALDRTSIGGMLAKLWGSKVVEVLIGAISEFPLGSPGREKPDKELPTLQRTQMWV